MRVRVRANRQVVHGDVHHYGGAELEAPDGIARQWLAWGWVEQLPGAAPVPTPDGPAAVQGRANVRARIAEELRVDATRSDREIARVVGCDHKTVAKHRAAGGWQAPPGVPQPTGRLVGSTVFPGR